MLKIPGIQFAQLRASKLERSRRRVLSYLRQAAPDLSRQYDDDSLYKLVCHYEASGNRLGLRSERAHAKWAYLMLMTDGEFDAPPVQHALADSSQPSADLALDALMAAMIQCETAELERAG